MVKAILQYLKFSKQQIEYDALDHSMHLSGQIIATSHDHNQKKVAKEWKSPYFRET